MSRTSPSTERRPWWWCSALLALAIYPPLAATGRGLVAGNVDAGLLIHPGRAIRRSITIWDPSEQMGTVSPDAVATLWPLGPWFWAAERLGLPDWLAQRLLLSTAMFAAGAGILFLTRTWRWRPTAGLAAAFVYAMSPFVVTPAIESIGLLFSFAAGPWLLAATVRAMRTPGWRHPAAFALASAVVGAVDPTAMIVACAVPVGWIVYGVLSDPEISPGHALSTAARISVLTLSVNLWWMIAAVVRITTGTNGRPVGPDARSVADVSAATEVLRGLGDRRSYARDAAGPLVDAMTSYTQNLLLLGVTLALPALGLLGLGIARWRQRGFLVMVLAGAVVIAVGAHPWDDPSPIGALLKALVLNDVGLAFVNQSKAVPQIVLATSLGLGALVGAMGQQVPRRGVYACVLVALLGAAGLPALWTGDLVHPDRSRPEQLPDQWEDAAGVLDRRGSDTRVLAVPGAPSGSYRWGESDGPVLPHLMERPFVTRSRTPSSSLASADLLAAFDQRLQDEMIEPDAIPAVARLLAAGDVIARNDLHDERHDLIDPRVMMDALSATDGLGDPLRIGTPTDGAAGSADGGPQGLAVFPVVDPVPIVRTHDPGSAVIVSGDGAGLVDAASAGIIDGSELFRYSADLTGDPDFVREILVRDRALIVTDTNRARARRWDTVRDSHGFTEQASGGLLRRDLTDRRRSLFDGAGPSGSAHAVHEGVQVRATSYGAEDRYQPEYRPVRAADGDAGTAWLVAGDGIGERLELTVPDGVATDRLAVLQAPDTDRRITSIALRFDGGAPVTIELDERSLIAPGQEVTIDEQDFEHLSLEILDSAKRGSSGADEDDVDTSSRVGLAEIDIGIHAREYIRMPDDLLDIGGFRTSRYPLALVQTRERVPASDLDRSDEELALARIVDLPTAREYRLSGTVRLSSGADSSMIDDILGLDPAVRATATTTSTRGLAHRPGNVLDGDPDTRWTSGVDPVQPALKITGPSQVVSRVVITAVDDRAHSVPRVASVHVPGRGEVGRAHFLPGADGTLLATIDLDVLAGTTTLDILFEDVERRFGEAVDGRKALPVAITSVDAGPLWVASVPATIDSGCRDDLVRLDDVGIPVRVTGQSDDALAGRALDLETCGGEGVAVPGGEHRMDAVPGFWSGFDIDQLVWCSSSRGDACAPGLIAPSEGEAGGSGPMVDVVASEGAEVEVEISGATTGRAFWLVLGQSFDPGWEIVADDIEAEPTTLVNGASNGFLVTAPSEQFALTIRYRPQNPFEIGLLLSIVGLVVTLGLALTPQGPAAPVPIPLQEPLRRIRALTWEGALPTRRDAGLVAVATGATVGLVVQPVLGLVLGIIAGLATRREGWRPLFTVAPASILSVCAVQIVALQSREHVPLSSDWPIETGVLHPVAMAAVLLLAADVLIEHVWLRRSDFR